MRARFVLALALSCACTPPPKPGPPIPDADAAPGPDCLQACATLSSLGCELGQQTDCPGFLTRVIGSQRDPNPTTGAPLTCADIARAKDPAHAQALGLRCP